MKISRTVETADSAIQNSEPAGALFEWRTHVVWGRTSVPMGREPLHSLVEAAANDLTDDPTSLEYRRVGDEEWVVADPSRDWYRQVHWLNQEQVAQLPDELGTVIFADLPPHREPLDFIAGNPEGGNFFEESIRAGALPHFDSIELGLIALRLFTLDRFKNARPDILMNEVADPQAAQHWWERCAHLIALLQDMQGDYEAVLAGAAGEQPPASEPGGAE